MTATTPEWAPFEQTNAIGDPGRQPEVVSVSGALNVGVSDTALDFITAGAFEVRACSTRGWSHRGKGTPRQDSHSLLVNETLLVVAVADGVSEGDFSQVAAETAARAAVKLAAHDLARNGAVDWLEMSRRISMRIIEEGEYRRISAQPEAEAPIDDRLKACLEKMSTTLIVAVINLEPTAAGFATEIGVVAGDSAAYLIRDGAMVPLGGGKETTDSITSTRVRPLPGTVEPVATTIDLQPGDVVVVGTDGIGDPVGDGTGEVGVELAHRWSTPPSIDQFLLDVNFYRRTFDDDRTAVGVWVQPDVELPEPVDEPVAKDTGDDAGDDAGEAEAPDLVVPPALGEVRPVIAVPAHQPAAAETTVVAPADPADTVDASDQSGTEGEDEGGIGSSPDTGSAGTDVLGQATTPSPGTTPPADTTVVYDDQKGN